MPLRATYGSNAASFGVLTGPVPHGKSLQSWSATISFTAVFSYITESVWCVVHTKITHLLFRNERLFIAPYKLRIKRILKSYETLSELWLRHEIFSLITLLSLYNSPMKLHFSYCIHVNKKIWHSLGSPALIAKHSLSNYCRSVSLFSW